MTNRFYRPAMAVLAFLLMVAMVVAAIGIGAYRSFNQEREDVNHDRDQLIQLVAARHGAAQNILTVASRHLPQDDSNVAELRARLSESKSSLPMDELWALDQNISRAADAVLASLRALDSVKADARDRMYVNQMLPQAIEQSALLVTESPYNASAAAHNARLNTQFSGRVAKWIGFAAFPLFAGEDSL